VAAAHHIAIQFDSHDVPTTLPDSVALCFYRVTQEAVQNAVKHSGATGANVTVLGYDGGIGLTIVDDGCGFDANAVQHNGSLGLVSMRERVRLINGQFTVHSGKGQGTRVEVRVALTGGEVAGLVGESTRSIEKRPSPINVQE
jgi:signal transduction histidine kinase